MVSAMAVVDVFAYVALVLGLVVAAVEDLKRRVVPNECVVVIAFAGFIHALVCGTTLGQVTSFLAETALGMAVAFVIMAAAGFISLWRDGEAGVGGGDIKLMAAVGTWVGPAWTLAVITASCALGVVGLLVADALRRFMDWRAQRSLHGSKVRLKPLAARGIPLAPAIAVSVVVVMALSLP